MLLVLLPSRQGKNAAHVIVDLFLWLTKVSLVIGIPYIHYNEHIVVPGDRPLLPWEVQARMAIGDPSLSLKVFVEHNPPPATPGGCSPDAWCA